MALEQGHFIRLFEKLHQQQQQQQQEQILMLYVIILVIYKNTMFINVCMWAVCVCADKSSVTAVMYANIARISFHSEDLYINIHQDN